MRGETPLHLAARANQTDIIRILLRNGAKVDARARVSPRIFYRFMATTLQDCKLFFVLNILKLQTSKILFDDFARFLASTSGQLSFSLRPNKAKYKCVF